MSNSPYERLKRIRELERHIRSTAQIIHQAYHTDQTGTWRSCPKDVCASARDVLGIERENRSAVTS